MNRIDKRIHRFIKGLWTLEGEDDAGIYIIICVILGIGALISIFWHI